MVAYGISVRPNFATCGEIAERENGAYNDLVNAFPELGDPKSQN